MIVRAATHADHADVLNLIRTIPTLPQWKAEDLAQSSIGSGVALMDRKLWVAGEPGGICGFAQASVVLDEAELEGMAVALSKRGQGMGRALLNACLRWAAQAGASQLRLEVRRRNRPAIELYASAGFQMVGIRQGYYREPMEDAILMQRNL